MLSGWSAQQGSRHEHFAFCHRDDVLSVSYVEAIERQGILRVAEANKESIASGTLRQELPYIRGVALGAEWDLNIRGIRTLPDEFFDYLRLCNAEWVSIHIQWFIRHSMDATVERNDVPGTNTTIPDDVLRTAIRRLREEGFHIELNFTLTNSYTPTAEEGYDVHRIDLGRATSPEGIPAEAWPWDPSHPQHDEYVAEFFETYTDAVCHYAQMAQDLGVELLSIGTEVDNLFRTRSYSPENPQYLVYLRSMVNRVRAIYDGWLTYGQFVHKDLDPALTYLWGDLDLDVISYDVYRNLACPDNPPLTCLEESVEELFSHTLLSTAAYYEFGKPVIFNEFGIRDVVGANRTQAQDSDLPLTWYWTDSDCDGLDDGEEEQARYFDAFFRVAASHDWFRGAFVFRAPISTWQDYVYKARDQRRHSFRGKLAEGVIAYWFGLLGGRPSEPLSVADDASPYIQSLVAEGFPQPPAQVLRPPEFYTIPDSQWSLDLEVCDFHSPPTDELRYITHSSEDVAAVAGKAPYVVLQRVEDASGGSYLRADYEVHNSWLGAGIKLYGDSRIDGRVHDGVVFRAWADKEKDVIFSIDCDGAFESDRYHLTTVPQMFFIPFELFYEHGTGKQGVPVLSRSRISEFSVNVGPGVGSLFVDRIWLARNGKGWIEGTPSIAPEIHVLPEEARDAGCSVEQFVNQELGKAILIAVPAEGWLLDRWEGETDASDESSALYDFSSGAPPRAVFGRWPEAALLFDEYHDQHNTISSIRARNLNRDHPDRVFFSRFAEELRTRYRLDRGTEALTDGLLAEYQILIIATPRRAFSQLERECIERFVANGGGLFVMGSYYRANLILNQFTKVFGIQFLDRYVLSETYDFIPQRFVTHRVAHHFITSGIDSLLMDWASALELIDGGEILSWSPDGTWLDKNIDGVKDAGEVVGPFAQAAAVEYGLGRVVAFADDSFLDFALGRSPGNLIFLRNAIDWLLQQR